MNEITGYIEMPFHGENGESAYEIAKRHGYEGTEAEWVESLGFIPNKSIGEEKLNEELVQKLDSYEQSIAAVISFEGGYEELYVNEYTVAAEEYTVPYRQKGVVGVYSIKIPKIERAVTVFDEANESLWSTASPNYRFCKVDVSQYVGKSIKIYGVSNSMPMYPCAFCTDAKGNILERYGAEYNTVYGYELTTGSNYTSADAIEAVMPDNAKFLYISGRCFTSGGAVTCDAVAKAEMFTVKGNAPNKAYTLMQSPLWGKKLYVDGDSICFGNGYAGGFGKLIADRFNMTLINNAVGGATISQDTTNVASFGTLDWENNEYYLRLQSFNANKGVSSEGFSVPITKEVYENGFGVYPTVYRLTDGELVEQEYSETMPTYTFFVKFNVPTYGENTVEKYYRMWSTNNWLWEAYKSGFAAVHEAGTAQFGTPRHWLCKSVEAVDKNADFIIFEGGLNEFLMDRPVGSLTKDMSQVVDTTTTVGAMEYVCRQLLEKCIGKKILFVLTHKVKDYANNIHPSYSTSKATLTDYHDAIVSVLEKYSIPVVDLYNISAFNTELERYLVYTKNNDGSHPTKEGYELFYVPQIVSKMESI